MPGRNFRTPSYHERPDRHSFSLRSRFLQRVNARRQPRVATAVEVEPTGLAWRTLTESDVPALIALISLVEGVENPPFRTVAEEVAELFAPGYLTDSIGGFLPDGTLGAFGFIRIAQVDVPFTVATLSGTVRPNLREQQIGSQLLGWQIDRSKTLIAELDRGVPAYVQVHVEQSQDDMRDLLGRHGFAAQGVITQMRRSLAFGVPAVDVPPHVRIEPWTEELGLAVKHAHDTAFEQASGPVDLSDQEWERARERLVPGWSFVALDRSSDRAQVAGYVLSSKWEDDWAALGWSEGYVEAIGVLEKWRGQGIARSLMSRTMKAMARDGLEYAGLDIDSRNPTGVQTVFEQLGFEPTHTTTQFVLDL